MSPRHRSIEVSEYNAFTDTPFAGNPAAVVTDAEGLDDAVMQRIARQMNLSETAFLVPAEAPGADIRIRWFTPTREVELCGHATIAAFTAAADQGIFPVTGDGERILRTETRSGRLRIRLRQADGRLRVGMQIPVPEFERLEVEPGEFAGIWGLTPEVLGGGPWLRNQLDYWYVPVREAAALRELRLDPNALREIDLNAAFCFYCTETVEPGSHWHLRFFAPFHGVPEDPVTGSAQGPMGVLYHEHLTSEPPTDGSFEYRGEQGDVMDRPGRVVVRLERHAGRIEDLEIEGTAVMMLEGRVNIG